MRTPAHLSSLILLVLVILLFIGTRVYKITEIPASLYWDEASIGYNAYSVLKTGKDEWGEFLPIHFRAFGEFKLPVYIYSVSAFQIFFGLSELSVRLPNVFYGLGCILAVYILFRKFIDERNALVGALIFSTLPWIFIFTRTGYEAVAGLCFYIWGLTVLFWMKRKEKLLIALSLFILSVYSYNSFRIVIPLTVIVLAVFYFQEIKSQLKNYLIYIFVGLIVLGVVSVPVYRLLRYDFGLSRLQQVSIFNSESRGANIFSNLLSNFSFNYLFITGDKNIRSQQLESGQLFLIYFPFLIFGVMSIFLERKREWWLSLTLLLIGTLPAVITKENPHALRSIAVVPFICLVITLGVRKVALYLQRFRVSLWNSYLLFTISVLMSFGFYFYRFITEYPKYSGEEWQSGYKQVFTQFSGQFNNYEKIYISDKDAQPYIFGLFYLQYDPESFRNNVVVGDVSEWGRSKVRSFDKFTFFDYKDIPLISVRSLMFSSDQIVGEKLREKDPILNSEGGVDYFVYEYQAKN